MKRTLRCSMTCSIACWRITGTTPASPFSSIKETRSPAPSLVRRGVLWISMCWILRMLGPAALLALSRFRVAMPQVTRGLYSERVVVARSAPGDGGVPALPRPGPPGALRGRRLAHGRHRLCVPHVRARAPGAPASLRRWGGLLFAHMRGHSFQSALMSSRGTAWHAASPNLPGLRAE